MATGRVGLRACLLAASAGAWLAGCAQSGPILGYRTRVGTLSASVSQLEHERLQLQKQMAELNAENRRIERRLAQEEAANGELSARLDDARVLLRGRGFDNESLAGSSPSNAPADPSFEPGESTRTRPVNRGRRTGRRPPFARIPGRIDPAPTDGDDEDADPFDTPPPSRRRRSADDPNAQSRNDQGTYGHWSRVARQAGEGRAGLH